MSSLTFEPIPSTLVPDFKQAMRRLAATVTIISVRHDGLRHGMAATAVNSVTTSPPTLLICINQSASIHAPLLASERFCVNLLAHQHDHLVPLFSGKAVGEERFGHGTWGEGAAGLPYLEDAQASLFCKVINVVSVGSHSVVIGEVEDVKLSGETRPLIYQDGGFFKTIGLDSP